MVDEGTRKSLQSIPLLQTRASPRDKDLWVQRLKEELMALIKVTYFVSCFYLHNITMNDDWMDESSLLLEHVMNHDVLCFQYVQNNKASDSDWFRLESNKEGTKWFGKCW